MNKILIAIVIAVGVVRAQAPFEANMTGGKIHYGGDRFEKAATLFKTATEQKPNSYDAHLWLAASLAKLQKKVEAAKEFVTVLQLDSLNIDKLDIVKNPIGQPEGKDLAQAVLFYSSVMNLQAGKLDDALAFIKAALKIEPLNSDNLLQFTSVALKMNNLDEVKQTAQKILAADSTSADAYNFMGRFYQAKGDWDSAKVYFNKGLELLTKRFETERDSAIAAHVTTESQLIGVLETLKSLHGTIDKLRAFVKDTLKIPDAKLPQVGPLIIRLSGTWQGLVLGYGEAGSAAFNKGDMEYAEKLYGKAVELDPENGEIAYNFGIVKFNLGKMGEAKDPLLKATQLFPNDDQAFALLGAVHVALAEDFLKKNQNADGDKELDTAITVLTKAIELNPKNANAHRALGIAYVHKGDIEKNKDLVDKGNELIKKGAELDKQPK